MPKVINTTDEEIGRAHREYQKQYYEQNKEKIKEANRKRYKKIPEDQKGKRGRRWYKQDEKN